MQDNALCHKAKKVMSYLSQQNFEVMDLPAQSPEPLLESYRKSLENIRSYGKKSHQHGGFVGETSGGMVKN